MKPITRFNPIIFGLFISVFLGINSCSNTEPEFHSEHFELKKITEGVYAAIHTPGGSAICNAGIIDLGDETLIFDTFLTPMAAEDLKKAADRLTGNTVRYVVNSHFHNDHIRGNQIFSNAKIISTEKTKDLILQYEPTNLEEEKEYAPTRLKELQDEYDQTQDSANRAELIMWIGFFKGMVESNDLVQIVLPDSLFSGEMTIKGKTRNIKLIEFDNGHTANDIILLIENEKIVFTGDLVFVDCHPYLPDGDPAALINILKIISDLDSDFVVPGHGPVGNSEDISEMISYVEQILQISDQLIAENQTGSDSYQDLIPKEFENWIFANFFDYNIKFINKLNAVQVKSE